MFLIALSMEKVSKRSGKRLEEQVIQKFPHRCPYCDQPIAYDGMDLKRGENKVTCPSCGRIYIKIIRAT